MSALDRAVIFAILAAALGPWVAAIWATGGFTPGGSPLWLRRLVVAAFFYFLLSAAGIVWVRL